MLCLNRNPIIIVYLFFRLDFFVKSVCFESRKSAAQQRERGRVTRVRTHTHSRAQSFKKRGLDFSVINFWEIGKKRR